MPDQRLRWRRFLAVTSLALAMLPTAVWSGNSAWSQTAGGSGVGITPARFEVDLAQRSGRFEVVVFNDTPRRRTIFVELVALGHDLQGSPLFGDPLEAQGSIAGEPTFMLDPGASRTLEIAVEFPDDVALYGAVLARVEPDEPDRSIAIRTQVASLLLLRGPKPWDQSLEVRDMGIEHREGEEDAAIWVDVANIGDAHVKPTGSLKVSQQGEPIAEVPLPGENIIPGYARRLRAAWVPPSGLAGQVDVDLVLDNGPPFSSSLDVGDIPARVAEERGDDESPGAAGVPFAGGENARPVLLPIVALGLLLLAILLLILVWRDRDDEKPEEPDDGVGSTERAMEVDRSDRDSVSIDA